MKCIAGCKIFTGGEIIHHEDCPFYPESLTKLYATRRLYLVVEVINGRPIPFGAEYTPDRIHAEAVRDAMPAREGVDYVVVGIDPIGSSEAANELITQNTQPDGL